MRWNCCLDTNARSCWRRTAFNECQILTTFSHQVVSSIVQFLNLWERTLIYDPITRSFPPWLLVKSLRQSHHFLNCHVWGALQSAKSFFTQIDNKKNLFVLKSVKFRFSLNYESWNLNIKLSASYLHCVLAVDQLYKIMMMTLLSGPSGQLNSIFSIAWELRENSSECAIGCDENFNKMIDFSSPQVSLY